MRIQIELKTDKGTTAKFSLCVAEGEIRAAERYEDFFTRVDKVLNSFWGIKGGLK